MSKTTDKINALLADYDHRRPGAVKPKPQASKAQHVSTPVARPAAPPPAIPSPSKTARDEASPFANRRPPAGLMWTTFPGENGSKIPILRVIGSTYDNYAAVQNTRPAGTYTIYKLNPRHPISYKCLAKDIQHYIEQDIKQEITLRENIAFTKRQEEAQTKATERAFLNQPGFYIVPGEQVGPNDETYNAEGPYYRFDVAGINLPHDNDYVTTLTPDENSDVEAQALSTAQHLPNEHVKIIEARNPVEAAAGRGHVWWQDGLFRGPPVDPRQRGFGF